MSNTTPETNESLPTKVDGDIEVKKFEGSIYQNSEAFDYAKRVAGMFKVSQLVPEAYRNNPADIMIAIDQANRLNISPLFLMQRMSIVKGKPVIEGQLVIALINERGPFKEPLKFKYSGEGDARQCVCSGVRRENDELCESKVTVTMAKTAGWYETNKNWKALTDQMLAYRSAMFLSRVYCPEVCFGMQLRDEVIDANHEKTIEQGKKISALNDRLNKK